MKISQVKKRQNEEVAWKHLFNLGVHWQIGSLDGVSPSGNRRFVFCILVYVALETNLEIWKKITTL